MSEEDETVDEAPEADETFHDPAKAKAANDKARREAANLRTRLKELEPLAAKAREADEAAKSELQKAAEARAAADKRATDAELLLLKRDIADDAGLPKSWASRLQGATKEELEADAKALAKDLPAPPTTAGNGRPVQDLRSAALPAGDGNGNPLDVDSWIRKQASK